MALRAKPPSEKEQRLKVVLYADKGAGKTHFCCSLPNTYYIDTEGLEDYKHFRKMLKDNKSDIIYLTELSEIIKEVKDLLATKHDYKTLIIDSLSFPYGLLGQMEVDRLIAKSPNTEGTEFQAHLNKGKRLLFHLGMLLTRLDMNVIVTSHEKAKFADGKEVGKTYDINDKMAYSLGSVWNLRLQGENHKLYVEKSRYPEMKGNKSYDFNDGRAVLEEAFGKEMFTRESKNEVLASPEQVQQFKYLVKLLGIPEDKVQKVLIKAGANSVDEISMDNMQKCIDFYQKQVLKATAQNEALNPDAIDPKEDVAA